MNKYLKALKRMNESLKPLCQYYNKKKVWFYIDALINHILYGVTPNQYIAFSFYKKSRLEKKTFYTRRLHYYLERKLNDKQFYNTFWNKQEFNSAFKDFVKRDWIYCKDASESQIADFIARHEKILVKPTSLSAGRGIHLLDKNEILGKELAGNQFLLEEYIEQYSAMNLLNPSSVNTLRIYTLITDNTPKILSITLRVGGGDSVTDNFHTGGVAYPVDVESGIVCGAGRGITGKKYLFHPSSNVKMIGFEIPKFEELKEFVYKATMIFPTARLIAWDVAITEKGFEMVEGNYNGNPDIMQSPTDTGMIKVLRKAVKRGNECKY